MQSIAGHLAAIEELRARAFPARCERRGWADSGPGYHIAALRVSEHFWDADPSRVREVDEEFDAELRLLIGALAREWGAPDVLDLTECLERSGLGEPVPPPLDTLCGYVAEVHTWIVDGRWVAVGSGRAGRELPIHLVAAIGEPDLLTPR
ncbi:hypothetical protein ACQUSR_01530 [Streptomyces sp. P1-3]|uniref:hypothetical protein n=1 Tax=Streptomyces sp. P1-3 TaxID=3421658 RepID=UPI003D36DAA8